MDQRLGRVVADDRSLAVRRAGRLRGVAFDDLLFPTQVTGERFIARLLVLDFALDRVGLDDCFGLRASASARAAWNSSLFSNGNQCWSGPVRIRFSLRWPFTKWLSSLRSFSISRPSSSIFFSCAAIIVACEVMVAACVWMMSGSTGFHIVRDFARLPHATYDNEIAKMRKWRHASFHGIQENILRDHRALASAECFCGDAASKW